MKRNEVLDLSYMALYISLAIVLDYIGQFIPILQMPNGGSINIAVIPVLISSYHLGYKKAVGVGLGWWLVGFIYGLNNWYLNPMQYLLDYIFPMSCIGLASLFPKIFKISNIYTGTIMVGIIRFLSTLLSGVYYWPPEDMVAGSKEAWIFSFTYNIGYNLATIIVAVIFVPIVINIIRKTNIKLNYIKE